jgi:hypothetical protein
MANPSHSSTHNPLESPLLLDQTFLAPLSLLYVLAFQLLHHCLPFLGHAPISQCPSSLTIPKVSTVFQMGLTSSEHRRPYSGPDQRHCTSFVQPRQCSLYVSCVNHITQLDQAELVSNLQNNKQIGHFHMDCCQTRSTPSGTCAINF